MPVLSPTMTEGNVARWLKAEGERVEAGEAIAEIETDKAMMELEAIEDGVLGKIVVPEGTEGVAVNTVIGVMLDEDEDASALDGLSFEAPIAAPPAAPAATPEAPTAPEAKVSPAPAAAVQPPAAPAAQAAAPSAGAEGRRAASPLARRMAERSGLDLATVTGSGPGGRIVRADIEAALKGGAASVPSNEAPSAPRPAPADGDYTEVPLSTMRKVIARRLTESKQTIPHFYLTIECEIDRLLALRKELNGREEGGTRLSVNDFVIKAAALALARVPAANASWADTAILRHNSVDVAVAVALEEGLITPIICHADHKGLATISTEMRDLAGRAKEGKLMPEEYQGGTFSISNLGMFGIREFAAVINPPQGAILAIGAGEKRAVVKDDALAVATVMSCTLSADHRVVDGAIGANLLKVFKSLIEGPLTMLL